MESATALAVSKRCPGCGERKPLTAFHNRRAAKDGKQTRCKQCQADYQSANREGARNRQRAFRKRGGEALKRKERAAHLLRTFGITDEQFDELLAGQDGGCGICHADEPGGSGTWHVDHDHTCCPGKKSCGKCIRGLLCFACNSGIGSLKDSPDLLLAGAIYLLKTGMQDAPQPGIREELTHDLPF